MTVIAPAAVTLAPNQPPDTTLLVPIDVLALAVGPASGVDSVPTETVIPISPEDAPDSATLPRPPQPFAAATPRKPGIHLHWAMPDALTRGDAGDAHSNPVKPGNHTNLRVLPDRWLVVRMVRFSSSFANGFMIDADLQRHGTLAGWTEHAPLPDGTLVTPEGRRYHGPKQLTAIAGGDPAWAATYDAVLDRFAFYDDVTGFMEGSVMSYLVVGWWSDPANNPLAGVTRQSTYVKRCTSLGWSAPLPVAIPPAPTPLFPTNVLLHGVVAGVPASGAGTDMRPDPNAIELGLGGTGYAALAAMLAEGTAAQRAASERVLAAFASGLLARIDTPDGLVAIDEDRHASAFVGVSAGTGAHPDRIAEGDPFETEPAPAPVAPPPAPSLAPRTGGARLERRDAHAVLDAVAARRRAAAAALTTDPTTSGQVFRDVPASNPRYFVPADLGIAIRGARRSRRHGEDSRLTPSGLVPCRLSHDLVLVAGTLTEAQIPLRLRVLPSSAVVPPECVWLMREAILVDPTRAQERDAWAGSPQPLRHPPIFVNRWSQPWVPLWADWEIGLRVDDDLRRWVLAATEIERAAMPDAISGAERVLAGRTLLHASASWAFASQIRTWLDEENRRDAAGQGQVSEQDEFALMTAASVAEGMDLLGGSLRGVREALLGLDPQRAVITRVAPDGNPFDKLPVERLPQLLAGGAATVRRLRLVDAFGRFLDVPDAVLAKLEVASTHRHPQGAPRVTLSPRFQRPARLNLRFVDPRPADTAPAEEARIDQQDPANAISPIAGWLLPDHVDEALECFDASGRPLGQLMHDARTEAVVFETAPGEPGSIGGPALDPDPGTRHVMRFAAGLVAADAAVRNDPAADASESTLSALLRGIDTTLWTVDPLGAVGTAAVAGLVGRPIAVVRALMTLDVLSDLDELAYPPSPSRADRARAYGALAARALAVRLGELTRTDDGLLAFFADDDYSQARLVAPEVRRFARMSGPLRGQLAALGAGSQLTPPVQEITHPYTSGLTGVHIRAGQTIRLTLLMNPGGKVHVTSGVLPRKALTLSRDWFHEALERLSPSFRVGPVLIEPTGVRMPRVTGLGDDQTFTRRTAPLTWRDDPILAASQDALLPDDPAGLQEGWIRVVPAEPGQQP